MRIKKIIILDFLTIILQNTIKKKEMAFYDHFFFKIYLWMILSRTVIASRISRRQLASINWI